MVDEQSLGVTQPGDPAPTSGHRAGIVALAGRPNVGKSTLVNWIVGTKISIVTSVPGTTRNTIRGVCTRSDGQIVLLDTPGLAKPSTLLSRRLNDQVRSTWSSVDLVLLVIDSHGGVGAGDEFLIRQLASTSTPIVAALNKIDRVGDKDALLPQILGIRTLAGPHRDLDVVPVSAQTGENVDRLVEVILSQLPVSPQLFPPDQVTDQPERHLAAEIVREKLIARARDELPHSIAVLVDEFGPDPERDDLLRIEAIVYVERDSQKAIVIGRGGDNLKQAATEARHDLEQLFGVKVFLSTHVKVAPRWQKDPKQLGRLGY